MVWGIPGYYGCPTLRNPLPWVALYPYNYTTHFLGHTQFNAMPEYYTPREAMDMQNLWNPCYRYMQRMDMYYQMRANDQKQAVANQLAANEAYQNVSNICFSIRFQNLTGNVQSLGSQLSEAIESDKVNDEQRAQLNTLKEEVKALNDKAEELAKSTSYDDIDTGLITLNGDLRALRNKAKELAEQIKSAQST